jgi:hypothetical protein
MEGDFLEAIGVLITGGGLAIAFITLKHRFKKDEQERNQKITNDLLSHAEWKKTIEFEIEKLKCDSEEIKTTRQKNLSQIWQAIEDVQEEHSTDMKHANLQFQEVLREIRNKNDELMKMLTAINNTVIEVKTQFIDHKESHNKKQSRERLFYSMGLR